MPQRCVQDGPLACTLTQFFTNDCQLFLVKSCANLRLAFENGFDNFATVRGDPDLKAIQKSIEYEDLMEKYDSKKGFNPFGLFK
jgi:hypothetical protein